MERIAMSCRTSLTLAAIATTLIACATAQSQRVGQSSRVQFGIVRSAQQVTLDSDAAKGALVGGMLGIVSGSGSSSRRARNAIIGAGAGGALAGAAEGNRQGMRYTVELTDGSSTTIVTDQREIREGDCVAIEQVGQTANIRRTSAAYCDRANQTAINSVADHSNSEAVACDAAKQELTEASTKEEVEVAARKIELLCNS
jgi:hypothetical protein